MSWLISMRTDTFGGQIHVWIPGLLLSTCVASVLLCANGDNGANVIIVSITKCLRCAWHYVKVFTCISHLIFVTSLWKRDTVSLFLLQGGLREVRGSQVISGRAGASFQAAGLQSLFQPSALGCFVRESWEGQTIYIKGWWYTGCSVVFMVIKPVHTLPSTKFRIYLIKHFLGTERLEAL